MTYSKELQAPKKSKILAQNLLILSEKIEIPFFRSLSIRKHRAKFNLCLLKKNLRLVSLDCL